ncbi:hypothetical protein GWI33_013334 [Rhynchophorus ferrugineus]|uniref:Uncharacterized protein n=1 Tax=Rhynchophorus ferrugineus TaxID=354439 RepID=A0A834I3Y4_RHYFE|nr:hypothetical protein GWI33_013334 [Rhynchophorus ferrugineus]
MLAYIVIFLVCLLITYKIYFKLTVGWCRSNVCLVGKIVLITGGNSGIGYKTACDLTKHGAKVIIACRSRERAEKVVKDIVEQTNNENVSYKLVDLGSLKSVREFVKEFIASEDGLDILINNAGMQAPSIRRMNRDGLHPVMTANYFGPFLLTNILLDLLKKSAPNRIINVVSVAAKSNLPKWLILIHSTPFTKFIVNPSFATYYSPSHSMKNYNQVTTYTLHPGAMLTKITRQMSLGLKLVLNFCLYWIFKTPLEGAQTTIHCAVAKNIERYSGSLFSDCWVVDMYKKAKNPELARELWSLSDKLVKLA